MGYGDRPPREMHKATCGDCGTECEVPFEPRQDKPVYCGECFPKHRPERPNRNNRFGGGGRRDGGGRGRFGDRRPREMHKTTCADCGNECEVPFKPNGEKPVYCNDCFANHKLDRN